MSDERPRTRFEAICDQIITAPAKSSKPRKRKATVDLGTLVEDRPASKKARKSLLEMLDEIVVTILLCLFLNYLSYSI